MGCVWKVIGTGVVYLCLRRSLVSIGSIKSNLTDCVYMQEWQPYATPPRGGINGKYDCSVASTVLKGCFLALLANCKPPNVSIHLWDASTLAGHPLNCKSVCFSGLYNFLIVYYYISMIISYLWAGETDWLIYWLRAAVCSLFEHTAISFWMFAIHLLHCWYPIKSVKGQP